MANVDECGIRIGCVAGRTKVVVMRTLKAQKVSPPPSSLPPISPSINNSLLARSRQLQQPRISYTHRRWLCGGRNHSRILNLPIGCNFAFAVTDLDSQTRF